MEIGDILHIEKEVDAVLIPHGYPIALQEGTEIMVAQYLGGNISGHVQGNMVMIQAEDAEKAGLVEENEDLKWPVGSSIEERVWHQLRQCYDPEIPVNIVDLGLIYSVELNDEDVVIVMTLTAPACGMGPFLVESVKKKVNRIESVQEIHVELVFDPPWSQEMMAESARLSLGML